MQNEPREVIKRTSFDYKHAQILGFKMNQNRLNNVPRIYSTPIFKNIKINKAIEEGENKGYFLSNYLKRLSIKEKKSFF